MRVGGKPDVSGGQVSGLVKSGDDWPISGDGIATRNLPGMPGGLISLVDWDEVGDPDVAADLHEIRRRPKPTRCRHCGRVIVPTGADLPGYTHELGKGSYLTRCKPEESGKPYGLVAEPKEDNDH
ncbi:hypothetical protein SEA_ABBA_49 [Arthrobacter phage Abba]|uniref:Uncharacterized protein n=1 Tax=Arthrobacter phage Abba TaxID=2713256 RepID=A0A6G8R343_9CAUD|nr:hypothetical protein HYQ28_gp49 [Arthrobacter phage Abba]QIN94378.1 hypothetical protein SEA_ABBA_49 [Arthrobacter phage Abba]